MYFIRLIFISVLVYYILKSVGKALLPFLFGKTVQNPNNQSNIKQKKNGDVTIYFEEKKNSKGNGKVGEYVDYEEIKD
jgi:hypothetical protein